MVGRRHHVRMVGECHQPRFKLHFGGTRFTRPTLQLRESRILRGAKDDLSPARLPSRRKRQAEMGSFWDSLSMPICGRDPSR